ncbi:MAG: YraN family protein [Chitinophagaceae bacterium]
MAAHNDLGKYGERLGVQFLSKKDYKVLHTNWKYSYFEIDLIASKNNVLHFIEIKTRKTKTFGEPEDDADQKKLSKIMKAAEEYQHRNPGWKRIQYDVLAISIHASEPPEFYLIEDVYYW